MLAVTLFALFFTFLLGFQASAVVIPNCGKLSGVSNAFGWCSAGPVGTKCTLQCLYGAPGRVYAECALSNGSAAWTLTGGCVPNICGSILTSRFGSSTTGIDSSNLPSLTVGHSYKAPCLPGFDGYAIIYCPVSELYGPDGKISWILYNSADNHCTRVGAPPPPKCGLLPATGFGIVPDSCGQSSIPGTECNPRCAVGYKIGTRPPHATCLQINESLAVWQLTGACESITLPQTDDYCGRIMTPGTIWTASCSGTPLGSWCVPLCIVGTYPVNINASCVPGPTGLPTWRIDGSCEYLTCALPIPPAPGLDVSGCTKAIKVGYTCLEAKCLPNYIGTPQIYCAVSGIPHWVRQGDCIPKPGTR